MCFVPTPPLIVNYVITGKSASLSLIFLPLINGYNKSSPTYFIGLCEDQVYLNTFNMQLMKWNIHMQHSYVCIWTQISLQLTFTIHMMKGNNVQLNQAALPPPIEMFSRIIS